MIKSNQQNITVSFFLPCGGAGDALCVCVVGADGPVVVLWPHVEVALRVRHQLLHLSHTTDYLEMDWIVFGGRFK